MDFVEGFGLCRRKPGQPTCPQLPAGPLEMGDDISGVALGDGIGVPVREVVFLGLTSPDGEALLQAPTRLLVDFLGRTYALCAQGREDEHLDVDAAIMALLAS